VLLDLEFTVREQADLIALMQADMDRLRLNHRECEERCIRAEMERDKLAKLNLLAKDVEAELSFELKDKSRQVQELQDVIANTKHLSQQMQTESAANSAKALSAERDLQQAAKALEAQRAAHADREEEMQEAKDTLEKALLTLEQEFRAELEKRRIKYQQLQESYTERARDVSDLKQLMKASVSKERKATALLDTAQNKIKELQAKADALEWEKSQYGKEFGRLMEEFRSVRSKLEETDNASKASASEHAKTEKRLRDVLSDNEDLHSQLRSLQKELERANTERAVAQARIEHVQETAMKMDKLQTENEKLRDAIRVKDVMMEDFSDTIAHLKADATHFAEDKLEFEKRDAELCHQVDDLLNENNKLRDLAEKQASEMDILQSRLEVRENMFEQLESKDAELRRLHTLLDKKSEVVKYVEQEVNEMRELFTIKEQKLVQAHAEEIKDMHKQMLGLNQQLEEKQVLLHSKEQRLEKARMELAASQSEVQIAKQKIAQTEEEMRIMLREMDKRKQAAMQIVKAFT
jgi:chromosome segregation ATPase